MTAPASSKNNRLTFFIITALVLGIALGFVLNNTYVKSEQSQLAIADRSIDSISARLSAIADTASAGYKTLLSQKAKLLTVKTAALTTQDKKLEPFSLLADIFLRLIKMIVAPLVFTTLVVGIAKQDDVKAVGRIGGRALLWFIGASLVSLVLGMVLINFFKPGAGMNLSVPISGDKEIISSGAMTLKDFVYHVFPTSLFDAMSKNEILQVVVFSIFFGIATTAVGDIGKVVVKAMDAIAHVILKMTGYIMKFAPVAVFGAMTAVVAKQGIGILETYSKFIAEFYVGLIVLLTLLLSACALFIGKRVFKLMRHIKEPTLLAFSTNSSEAAFPKTMLELERFGCDDKIVSFVLPLGYSFNLDGSMLYMTYASIFIAQAYNIPMDMGRQITMLLVLMLTSKGVAGVPRAALVIVAGTLTTFKLPEAGMALLLGIDPLFDMGRAAMNVIGNSVATTVVCKMEGKLQHT